MKEPFHFKDDLSAYSVDRLIELCKDQKNNDTAFNHIRQGNIEKWLNYIGEVELCNIVNETRKKQFNILNKHKSQKVECVYKRLSEQLNNRKFIKSLDIDKAIEITLKEYETLWAEILQNIQERNQLIGLGLAAIFTVAGFGLAPLAGFFTVEEISVKTPIEIQRIDDKVSDLKDQNNKIKLKKF
ncbi:hypothetical protein [Aphanothece sacrum]|uniref:Uncharacterized protein n=1 Tax=Aphanothece sacrum FPU1 TaxID=1920663 RepID=A0A401IG34_APHSA|nr:hypothetical protein [Aphanothece sacrum]GBF80169.1 hypothetical protein AsFPU1_1570 [Aphanothece sacrum FPU1]GBF85322.1 hypothetical protein AsFPU3_2381 [Aphanothece sacrum FPU3]